MDGLVFGPWQADGRGDKAPVGWDSRGGLSSAQLFSIKEVKRGF